MEKHWKGNDGLVACHNYYCMSTFFHQNMKSGIGLGELILCSKGKFYFCSVQISTSKIQMTLKKMGFGCLKVNWNQKWITGKFPFGLE